MRVSLRTKLIGALILVLALTGAVGWAGLRAVQRANGAAQRVYDKQVGPVVELSHTAGDIREQRQLVLLHVITADPAQLPPLEAEILRLDSRTVERFDELARAWAGQPTELGNLDRLRGSYAVFRRLWNDRILPLSRQGAKAEAADIARGPGQSAFLAVDDALNQLVAASDVSVRTEVAAAHRAVAADRRQLVAVLVAAFLVALGLVVALARGLVRGVTAVAAPPAPWPPVTCRSGPTCRPSTRSATWRRPSTPWQPVWSQTCAPSSASATRTSSSSHRPPTESVASTPRAAPAS